MAKTDEEGIPDSNKPRDSVVMPPIAKEIDIEALLGAIQEGFDPEQDLNDRHILHEVTGLSLVDFANLDPDIQRE